MDKDEILAPLCAMNWSTLEVVSEVLTERFGVCKTHDRHCAGCQVASFTKAIRKLAKQKKRESKRR